MYVPTIYGVNPLENKIKEIEREKNTKLLTINAFLFNKYNVKDIR